MSGPLADHPRHINLDDLGDDVISVELPLSPRNGNDDSGNPEASPHISPTVSLRNLEGRQVQDTAFPRPWWLRTLPMLDAVFLTYELTWASSQNAAKLQLTIHDDSDNLSFTTALVRMSYVLQVLMALMMIIALWKDDKFLKTCLRIYVVCSYILLAKAAFFLFRSIRSTGKTEAFRHQRWQRILGNVMCLILRFSVIMLIRQLLKVHREAVSSQTVYGRGLGRVNFRRMLRNQPSQQMPVVLAREHNNDVIESAV